MLNAPELQLLLDQNQLLKNQIVLLKQTIEKQSSFIAELTSQLNWLKRQIFGTKSERATFSNDLQCTLDLGIAPLPSTAPEIESITYDRTKSSPASKTPHGREEIPAHIPRKTIVIEPDYDTTNMEQIAEKVTEQLEYVPPQFFVNRYVRPVHRSVVNGQPTLLCPDLPPLCSDKGKLGATLIAQTIISKCQDHLPHYRTAQMIARDCAMTLPESTIRDGFRQGVFMLEAIEHRLRELALQSSYMQMDESTIKVMIKPTRGKSHQGYMWVQHSPLEKIVLFSYQKTRSVERGKKLLEDFSGTLQSDGLDLYVAICQERGLVHAGCMDHARRYFDKALTNDKVRATEALDLIRPLYAIEEDASERALSHDDRLKLRTEKSVPLLAAFFAWCMKHLEKALPKTPFGKAINYALERKVMLSQFITDGRIEMSNILIENRIRPLAVGRKNYMFSGSEDGAERLAIGYSIIGTCIANKVNPRDYLNHVLAELPKRTANNIDDLLPMNWKPLEELT